MLLLTICISVSCLVAYCIVWVAVSRASKPGGCLHSHLTEKWKCECCGKSFEDILNEGIEEHVRK